MTGNVEDLGRARTRRDAAALKPGFQAPETAVSWVPRGREALWLTVETVVWSVILGHIAHWASDAGYYVSTQVSYLTQAKNGTPVTVVGSVQPGDWWDRLPVHLENITGWNFFGLVNNGQQAPLWWVTWRHDIRYVLIGLAASVIVSFLTSKPPKQRRDYSWQRLAATPLLVVAFALPGLAVAGVIAYYSHGLTAGWTPPASWGALGDEVGQWVGSGKLALIILGLFGGQFFAKYASKGPADFVQWAYAERKANQILTERTGKLRVIGNLRDAVVIGPPGYRRRVHYLVNSGVVSEAKGAGLTVFLSLAMFLTLAMAGYGAWLTLAGPAARH